MSGEFDKDGIGWFIANDYLYAVNQETFKWKRYPLPQHVFMAIHPGRQQEPGMVIYWQGKIFI
jgi:hypothetical protein